MNGSHAELWRRIREFSLDASDAKFTFTARLARDNGWPLGFAHRVVGEYKRFVFLAMAAGHEVTPSDAVDEAWHLHLVYTQSYWHDFCRDVLKRPLHHHPTRGGSIDGERHAQQYEQTLASYAEFFGHEAPADIWPPAEIRFRGGSHHVRVDRNQAWIVPKPRWPWLLAGRRTVFVGAAIVPFVMGVANPLDLNGSEFLTFYVIVCVTAVIAAIAARIFLRDDTADLDDSELSSEEIACLARGVPGVMEATLASLVAENRLKLSDAISLTPNSKNWFLRNFNG